MGNSLKKIWTKSITVVLNYNPNICDECYDVQIARNENIDLAKYCCKTKGKFKPGSCPYCGYIRKKCKVNYKSFTLYYNSSCYYQIFYTYLLGKYMLSDYNVARDLINGCINDCKKCVENAKIFDDKASHNTFSYIKFN
jgi:hypothetical protein